MFEGMRTLPLYSIKGRTKEEIPAFSTGKVELVFDPPELEPSPYRCDYDSLSVASKSSEFCEAAAKTWLKYSQLHIHFLQFKDDSTKQLSKALSDHVELLSLLCDIRLGLDPTPFNRAFEGILLMGHIYSDYRDDEYREENYQKYAARLDEIWTRLTEHYQNSRALVERMLRMIASKRTIWSSLDPLVNKAEKQYGLAIKVFCSYAHKDELIRGQLDTHLSLLRRQGAISSWHDRMITAGQEWKGEIDKNLMAADVVLLLISADFIHSDYCFDVEMQAAFKRREEGKCEIVPIIIRSCDWNSATFGKLQALPKDGKAVTSWSNHDEAWTDVAKGLRLKIDELKTKT